MKGLKLAKRIIVCTLIVMSTILLSFIPIELMYKAEEDNSNFTPSGTYTFTSENITQEIYDTNTTFEIKDEAGWRAFTRSADSKLLFTYKGNYTDKKVVLGEDITITDLDYTHSSASVSDEIRLHIAYNFNGEFDGKGHTITYSQSNTTGDTLEGKSHFIGHLQEKGVIRNVRFKNMQFVTLLGQANTFGGIVDTNDGLIEKCIVDNFSVVSDQWDEHCIVAPFAKTNNATIKNCIIMGTYKCDVNGNGAGWDGYQPHWFVIGGNQPTNCIFAADIQLLNKDNGNSDCSGIEGDIPTGNFRSFASAYTNMTSDVSSTAGDAFDNENENLSPWYKYKSEYGLNGKGDTVYTIYLRPFMSWVKINFVAGKGGTITQAKLIVPGNCEEATIGLSSVVIYKTTITAVPNSLYTYATPCWTKNSDTLFTANFIRRYIYVKFASCTGAANAPSYTNLLSADYNAGNPQIGVVYNTSTGSLKMSYVYNGEPFYVDYGVLPSRYYYKSYLTTKEDTDGDGLIDIVTITPQCYLKEYGIFVK